MSLGLALRKVCSAAAVPRYSMRAAAAGRFLTFLLIRKPSIGASIALSVGYAGSICGKGKKLRSGRLAFASCGPTWSVPWKIIGEVLLASKIWTASCHVRRVAPGVEYGAKGRTWQEAVQIFDANKTSPMIFQGTDQVGPQLAKANLPDLSFFPFPQIDPAYPTDSAIDAPIDGFLMSKKVKNRPAAAALME